jgi:hypothetical protein
MSDEQPFKVGDRVVYDPAAPLNTSEPLSFEYEDHHEIMNAPELEILGVEGGQIYQYLTFALWSDDQYAASRFKPAPTDDQLHLPPQPSAVLPTLAVRGPTGDTPSPQSGRGVDANTRSAH